MSLRKMNKTSIFSLTAALMMTANLHAQSSYTVTVNPNICYQTIADFGSSDCWTADFVGKYFSNTERKSQRNGSSVRKWMPMAIRKASVSLCGALTWVPVLQNKAVKAVSKISLDVATVFWMPRAITTGPSRQVNSTSCSKPRNMESIISCSSPIQPQYNLPKTARHTPTRM